MGLDANNVFQAFVRRVRAHFMYLEANYGFKVSKIEHANDSGIVRYESEAVYVNVYYGSPDFEVNMNFGRKVLDEPPQGYSFYQGDLILLESCSSWQWKTNYADKQTRFIAEYARLLQECGRSCLLGDSVIYSKMKLKRDTAVSEWVENEKVTQIRGEAQKAWNEKQYGLVVILYRKMIDKLTEVEQKRLDYAEKKMA